MGELWQGGRAREGRVWGIRRESPPRLHPHRMEVSCRSRNTLADLCVYPIDRLLPSSSFTTYDTPSRPPCRRPTRSSSSSHSSSSCSEPTSSRRYNTARWQPRSGSAVAWSERSYSAGFVPWRRRPSCWTLGNRSLYPASLFARGIYLVSEPTRRRQTRWAMRIARISMSKPWARLRRLRERECYLTCALMSRAIS